MRSAARVVWHETLASTNTEALRLASAGEKGPLWIATKTQTAGRGRRGRVWQSAKGNLYTTALFTEPAGLDVAARTPFAAGLAVIDACQQLVAGIDLKLKWPNDVRSTGRKLCGILVETVEVDGCTCVACGIGVNVETAPHLDRQKTTSLALEHSKLSGTLAGTSISAQHMLEALTETLFHRIEEARGDFPGLLEAWKNQAEGLGQRITAGSDAAPITGIFTGLREDGALLLQTESDGLQAVTAGDVALTGDMNKQIKAIRDEADAACH